MENGFSTTTVKVSTSDGRNFILLEPVKYTSKDGRTFIMPIGATSDGASTPPELWPFMPPFGKYWLAAFFHDTLYRNTAEKEEGTIATLPKEECDYLLKESMESLGVSDLDADKFYWGVTLGGWSSFDRDRGL